MNTELGIFGRQALIEKLVNRFAALNGYEIEPMLRILDAKHPQIKTWIAMAEAAIDEIEKLQESDDLEED